MPKRKKSKAKKATNRTYAVQCTRTHSQTIYVCCVCVHWMWLSDDDEDDDDRIVWTNLWLMIFLLFSGGFFVSTSFFGKCYSKRINSLINKNCHRHFIFSVVFAMAHTVLALSIIISQSTLHSTLLDYKRRSNARKKRL